MKRIIFYFVLLIQIVTVSILAWQYHLIDNYGESIRLLVDNKDYSYYEPLDYQGNLYVNYKINKIANKNWKAPKSIDYNQNVYVLLEEGEEGIYKVTNATIEKPTPNTNQIVLIGKYLYYDMGFYHVNYGIEQIKNKELFQHIDFKHPFVVTVKVAPWGQMKVVAIENF